MTNPEWSSLRDRPYSVNIGEWVGCGWAMVQQESTPLVGFFVTWTAIDSVFLAGLWLIGLIPIVVLGPVLNAGFAVYTMKMLREQPRTFSDFFDSFRCFDNIVLCSVMTGLLTLLALLPACMILAIGFWQTKTGRADTFTIMLMIVGSLLAIAGLLASTYLEVSYLFAIHLILDRRVGFWPAMEMSRQVVQRHWWQLWLFTVVLGSLNFAGLLTCGLGLVLTTPLTQCAVTYAYAQVFGLAPKVSLPNPE